MARLPMQKILNQLVLGINVSFVVRKVLKIIIGRHFIFSVMKQKFGLSPICAQAVIRSGMISLLQIWEIHNKTVKKR